MNYLTSNVIQTYHDLVRIRARKISNIIGLIAIASLVAAIILFLIERFNDEIIFVLILIFLSHFIVLGIIGFVVRYKYTSEKPLYTYLYPKVLEEIQYNEKHDFKYESYPKIKEFIKESKLFTKYASNKTRCGIRYRSDEGYSISIFDTYYYTQTNNSVIVHFNGYYVVVDGIQAENIQVRTKGRPPRSEINYTKMVHEKGLKVYCEKPHAKTNDDIINMFNELQQKLNTKHLFVNATNQKLYIAIDRHKPKRKIKVLDQQSYGELRDHLLHLTNALSNEADHLNDQT